MATRLVVNGDEEGAALGFFRDVVRLRTEERVQFVDLTELVAERVRWSGVREGLACVQTCHTTTAVVVNENERGLLEDVKRTLERLAPGDLRYAHDDPALRGPGVPPDERWNGDAHCKAILLGASESLGIVDGRLQLGRWQRIFLVELDGGRERTFTVLVLGTKRRADGRP